jgi:hypothetical protein
MNDSLNTLLQSTLPGAINTAVGAYGVQNAGQAIQQGETAGINTQAQTMKNVQGTWQPQQTLGAGADAALSSSLGLGGQPANPANFLNMPGYTFSVQQGEQAAERQAAAMGNAGNSGTAAMIGNQVTGTAMQDYNNYIGQLTGAANLGSTANTGVANAFLNTGGTISQLQQNSGLAQASIDTGVAGQLQGGMGYNGSGVSGSGGGGLGGLIGSGLNYLTGGGNPMTSGPNGGSIYASSGTDQYGNPTNGATQYATPDGNGGFTYSDPNSGGGSTWDGYSGN